MAKHFAFKSVALLMGAMALATIAANSWATASTEDIARLGADLTPMGAEKGGNADGTIPAWNGGITQPPVNYKPGDHHPGFGRRRLG